MLEMRAKCERCGIALQQDSDDVVICSFECTFCRDCNDTALKHTCPNCGGELVKRPRRL